MDLYNTATMVAAVELMPKRPMFLRDRFFPLAADAFFPTEEVLVEYQDESKRKLAPIVAEKKGGIVVGRGGYATDRFTPPYVAPERPLTIDDLRKKGFGEDLFSRKTPEERAADILRRDLADLTEMIDSREEYMAAQSIFNNGYEMPIYADKYGEDEVGTFEMKFYDESSNPAVYTPGADWSTVSTAILGDLGAMVSMLTKRGLAATDVVMGPETADVFLANETIQKLLDNRRYEMGSVNPEELPEGAALIARINVKGRILNVFSYEATYVDENEENVPFIPEGHIAVTAEGAGNRVYGAVTQLEQLTNEFATYESGRVPQVIADAGNGVRTLREKSRPLLFPKVKNPWVSAKVLTI